MKQKLLVKENGGSFLYCKCLDVEQICDNLRETKVVLLKLSAINFEAQTWTCDKDAMYP